MLQHVPWLTVLVCCFLGSRHAAADIPVPAKLTRDQVIELARRRAPTVRIADTRVTESRGRLLGARVLLPENPALEVMAGPRWTERRTTDVDVTLALPVPLGGRRDKRIAIAEAGVDRDTQLAYDAQRTAIGVALAAYYRTLHTKARIEVAQARKTLADDLVKTANERRRAGDVSQLEVNLALAEVARAESEILAEQSDLSRARAELAISLGLAAGEEIDVDGRLDDRAMFDATMTAQARRPDLLAARAEVEASASDVALADALRWPDLALRIGYRREGEGSDIVLGGLAISLPFFERGQGARAEARARNTRAVIELENRTLAVGVEAKAARLAYQIAVEAVKRLDEKGLPLAIQNEGMARESYRAGKIDLATLLVVRREALDTRKEHLERLRDAALAGVDLALATGAL